MEKKTRTVIRNADGTIWARIVGLGEYMTKEQIDEMTKDWPKDDPKPHPPGSYYSTEEYE